MLIWILHLKQDLLFGTLKRCEKCKESLSFADKLVASPRTSLKIFNVPLFTPAVNLMI